MRNLALPKIVRVAFTLLSLLLSAGKMSLNGMAGATKTLVLFLMRKE